MGWRERFFRSRIRSQICTVSKSGSFILKQKAATQNATDKKSKRPSLTAVPETETVSSPKTSTASSSASSSSSAAAAAAAAAAPQGVVGINAALVVACAHPKTKEFVPVLASSKSSSRICRICQDKTDDAGIDKLIAPCGCSGSTKYVHQSCLNRWTRIKGSIYCEICQIEYSKEYVKVPFCTREDIGTYMSTLTILLLLVGVVATGIYLIVNQLGRLEGSSNKDNGYESESLQTSPTDIWVSVGILVSGLTGICLFLPFIVFFCVMKLRLRCRRRTRVTPHTINV